MMNRLNSWPMRMGLGTALLASAGGGWWWLYNAPEEAQDEAAEEVVVARAEENLTTPPQGIPIGADDSDSNAVSRGQLNARHAAPQTFGAYGSHAPAGIGSAPGRSNFAQARPVAFDAGDDEAHVSSGFAARLSDDGGDQPPVALPQPNGDQYTSGQMSADESTDSVNISDQPARLLQPPTELEDGAPATRLSPPTDMRGATEPTEVEPESSDQGPPPAQPAPLRTPPTAPARAAPAPSRTSGGSNMGSAPLAAPRPASNAPDSAQVPTATAPVPGDEGLEGLQNPRIAIEKVAPDEIQVGIPATFEIYVRNDGAVAAHDVVVTDPIPAGTQLMDATPEYTQSPQGLTWNLGTLAAGREAKITVQLMPEREGEIGSVAEVEFRARASVRTVCTKPQLKIEHSAPQQVLIGETVTFAITFSNPGTGAATGVVLQEDVPPGLTHPAGPLLEYDVGVLRPGETRSLQLVLRADKAGVVENVIHLRGDGDLRAEHRLKLEVVAPQLQVGLRGPSRRYLEREAVFEVSVANSGTATAHNVDLVAHLPKGIKFLNADNKGQYDPRSHAVYWSLDELPAGDSGATQFTVTPLEEGEQRVRVEGTAELDLEAAQEHVLTVEHRTELTFSVEDAADPIEVDAETAYEIRIVNNGAKPIANVQLAAALSEGMEFLRGEGPTKVSASGGEIVAEPIARLAARQEASYRVYVKGRREGDHVIRVQIVSDDTPSPVTKEEATRVYQDQ